MGSLHPRTYAITALMLIIASGCTPADETPDGFPDATLPDIESEVAPYTRSAVDLAVPEFSLTTLSGDTFSPDDLTGKVTLINFWATWCGPCVIEIPELVVLYDDWKDRNFEIIGVSMDDEGFDLVRPFSEEFAINYPVVIDDGTLADELGGVYALPTTFIVDENGRVVERFIGLFPVEEMRGELDAMISRTE